MFHDSKPGTVFVLAAILLVSARAALTQEPSPGSSPDKLSATIPLSNTALSSLANQILAAHNQVRSEVGVGPLRWSEGLAAYAQEWADWLFDHNAFQHHSAAQRREHHFGENLFEIEGGVATPTEVVTDWANEVVDYDYRHNSCRNTCGHYTQIVWRETKEVGCAVARPHKRGVQKEIWVCEYDPPGNYVGERPY